MTGVIKCEIYKLSGVDMIPNNFAPKSVLLAHRSVGYRVLVCQELGLLQKF